MALEKGIAWKCITSVRHIGFIIRSHLSESVAPNQRKQGNERKKKQEGLTNPFLNKYGETEKQLQELCTTLSNIYIWHMCCQSTQRLGLMKQTKPTESHLKLTKTHSTALLRQEQADGDTKADAKVLWYSRFKPSAREVRGVPLVSSESQDSRCCMFCSLGKQILKSDWLIEPSRWHGRQQNGSTTIQDQLNGTMNVWRRSPLSIQFRHRPELQNWLLRRYVDDRNSSNSWCRYYFKS